MTTYVDLVAPLALPSHEQTERFADHLTDVLAWDDALVLGPGRRLVVFLDPNAGASSSALPWRERFGVWNHALVGAELPHTVDVEGGLVVVPKRVTARGACALDTLRESGRDHRRRTLHDTLTASRAMFAEWRAFEAAIDLLEAIGQVTSLGGVVKDARTLRRLHAARTEKDVHDTFRELTKYAGGMVPGFGNRVRYGLEYVLVGYTLTSLAAEGRAGASAEVVGFFEEFPASVLDLRNEMHRYFLSDYEAASRWVEARREAMRKELGEAGVSLERASPLPPAPIDHDAIEALDAALAAAPQGSAAFEDLSRTCSQRFSPDRRRPRER